MDRQHRNRRLSLGVLCVLLLPALALAWLAIASRSGVPVGRVDGKLRPCPDTPNCVVSEPPGGPRAVAPFSFRGEPGAAFAKLIDLLPGEPRARLIKVEKRYLHAEFRSRILGFRDDVEFRLDPAAGVIHVRSASRVGRSDLGANRERIDSLRERWIAASTPEGTGDPAR